MVLAGNYTEAVKKYPRQIKSGSYKYMESAADLEGIDPKKVIIERVGKWFERPDINEIEEALKALSGN